jgi:hypothetical protein
MLYRETAMRLSAIIFVLHRLNLGRGNRREVVYKNVHLI